MLRLIGRKIHIKTLDSISGESLCFLLCLVREVVSCLILPVLGIMACNTGRKLKEIEVLLFHSSAIAVHLVLGHSMLVS